LGTEIRDSSPERIILGRPTDKSITVNTVADRDLDVYVEYGTKPGDYTGRVDSVRFAARKPIEIDIDNLQANTRYYYRLRYCQPGAVEFVEGKEHKFHTQRPRGSSFTFTVVADSHLGTDKHCNPALYRRTMLNALADQPDFHIDLGDTFRATKLQQPDYDEISKLHLAQRHFLGLVCHSAPLFFVIGNHEAELGWLLDGTEKNAAVQATLARKDFCPNPIPNEFYTGCKAQEKYVGLRENYYAWHWGDALFVALDPWWYTTGSGDRKDLYGRPRGDMWRWTLGREQYRWFKSVLQESGAKFKFVFSHHVLGSCRGGIEWVDYYEWGGRNRDGEWEFDSKRPGWEMPIHQLMVKNKVTIFFQGHDHVFVKQQCDGMIYQTCPMPGESLYELYNSDAYRSGVVLPNAGHIRVQVSASQVRVDYVRSYLPEDEDNERKNGQIAHSYAVP
jgi:hypothetical protein